VQRLLVLRQRVSRDAVQARWFRRKERGGGGLRRPIGRGDGGERGIRKHGDIARGVERAGQATPECRV